MQFLKSDNPASGCLRIKTTPAIKKPPDTRHCLSSCVRADRRTGLSINQLNYYYVARDSMLDSGICKSLVCLIRFSFCPSALAVLTVPVNYKWMLLNYHINIRVWNF